jgi:hypothetical protein
MDHCGTEKGSVMFLYREGETRQNTPFPAFILHIWDLLVCLFCRRVRSENENIGSNRVQKRLKKRERHVKFNPFLFN